MERYNSRELLNEINDLRDAVTSDLLTFLPIGNRIHVYDDGFEELTSFTYNRDKPVKPQVVYHLQCQSELAEERAQADAKEDYEQ